MFGRLTGIITHIEQESIILDVSNVGYEVYLPYRTLIKCKLNETYSFFIDTQIEFTRNIMRLYGFEEYREKNCMQMLITVKGISYRLANAVLGMMTVDEFISAIYNKEAKLLCVGGIGIVGANNIIGKLYKKVSYMIDKDGVNSQKLLDKLSKHRKQVTGVDKKINLIKQKKKVIHLNHNGKDAVSVLINLGYDKQQSEDIISALFEKSNNLSAEEYVKSALVELTNAK